jgi:hypothetical protein
MAPHSLDPGLRTGENMRKPFCAKPGRGRPAHVDSGRRAATIAASKGAAMKSVVVYSSKHHMNTEKVAQAIAGELKTDARKATDVKPTDLAGYELIGFGSGINGFDVHPEMHALVAASAKPMAARLSSSQPVPRAGSGRQSSARS